jgi:hypothetical protein
MKFLKLALVTSVLLSLLFGCKKKSNLDSLDDAKKIELTPTTFDFVGQEHNAGLEYVFENIFAKNPNSKFKDVKDASVKYVFEVNSNTKASKDDKFQFETNDFKDLIKKATKAKSLDSLEHNFNRNLTKNQTDFIRKLSMELTNTKHTYDEIVTNIIKLEKSAIKDFGENEIVYALCLSSVAKHSIEYWNTAKVEKWFKLFKKQFQPIGNTNSNTLTLNRAIDWHNVAVADVLGFGAGFPSGVTVGMVAGGLAAGVATGGAAASIGAVLGGLVGGSATGLVGAVTASAGTLAAEVIVSWFS